MIFEKRHGGFLKAFIGGACWFDFRYSLNQICSDKNQKRYLYRGIDCCGFRRALAMERCIPDWKFELERIWSAHAPDYSEAVRLVQHIAGTSEEAMLRQAASQALPILRGAAFADADHLTRDAARRRLGVIREVLLTLSTPQFGKRQEAVKQPTPEERYRNLLGLPLGCRLTETEIHHAYKRRAKHAHPDAGGNVEAFLKLSAARDALMEERRTGPRN
jgi:hypothetical protein